MSLYDHVAVIAPGVTLDRRAALAAAARSNGHKASAADDIGRVREQLQSLSASVPTRAAARRRVAETADRLEAERERVATLRGRLEAGDDVADAYRQAIADLSEAETDHAAAKERLDAARERAREARDVRQRRLRLEDELGNLERAARAELAEAVRPAVDEAVAALPGCGATTFDGAGPVPAALALARAGCLERPLTLACRHFPTSGDAEAWLGVPVVSLRPMVYRR